MSQECKYLYKYKHVDIIISKIQVQQILHHVASYDPSVKVTGYMAIAYSY